ncbi:MAG: hypothetical protein Q9221_008144 [Calogaya cf. arnoldii]
MIRKLMELMTGTDSNDLLIFYYGGYGRGGRTPDEGPCILISGKYQVGHWMVDTELDFATAKKPTLDAASADVLYLLDSCHASTAAIKPGKELIAASAVKTTTLGLRAPYSFTAAIIQELNQAVSAEHFLTAAALLQNTRQQPRTSIFLAPLWSDCTVPYPPNLLGNKSSDIRATLFVRVRNGDHHHTLQNMRHWLATNRPSKMGEIDVSVDHAASSTSITSLVFTISIPTYYSLRSHPAISFMAYVRSSNCVDKPSQKGDNSACRDKEYCSDN